MMHVDCPAWQLDADVCDARPDDTATRVLDASSLRITLAIGGRLASWRQIHSCTVKASDPAEAAKVTAPPVTTSAGEALSVSSPFETISMRTNCCPPMRFKPHSLRGDCKLSACPRQRIHPHDDLHIVSASTRRAIALREHRNAVRVVVTIIADASQRYGAA